MSEPYFLGSPISQSLKITNIVCFIAGAGVTIASFILTEYLQAYVYGIVLMLSAVVGLEAIKKRSSSMLIGALLIISIYIPSLLLNIGIYILFAYLNSAAKEQFIALVYVNSAIGGLYLILGIVTLIQTIVFRNWVKKNPSQ